jgi:phytoene dehydrogenase-like protein
MKKKIAIIGAGIAGLSAGIYAQMNGFDSEIYESHNLPGGLCTSWKRGEYTFDGCIHWLTGTGEKDSFYKFWNEIGALKGKKIIDPDEFMRFTHPDGTVVKYYTDMDKLERHLIELAPEDTKQIKKLCKMVKKMSKMKSPLDKPFSLMKPKDIFKMIIKMLPYMKLFKYLNTTSIKDYADTFQNKHIRKSLKELLYMDDFSLSGLIFTLSSCHNKSAGYPIGGSLEFSRSIERKYLALGGKIRYNSFVEKINVENGQTKGIQLKSGEVFDADYVISAGDLYLALEQLLDGRLEGSPFEDLFKNEKTFPSSVQVSFGANRDFSDQPNSIIQQLPLKNSITIAGVETNSIAFKHYALDPTLAPKGKSTFIVFYSTDFDYWEKLKQDIEAYKREKQNILHQTIQALEEHFPGIMEDIEVSDVATPLTYQRYTHVWKGSYMTWIQTPRNSDKLRRIPYQLPGIKNLYFSGMWLMPPGGLPCGLKTSRDIIQIICHEENKSFRSS